MNGILFGVIMLSIWTFGILILRGIGECIQRLRRIESNQRMSFAILELLQSRRKP
jgi:hypothetical protein